MELALVFGMIFGFMGGFGTKHAIDYNKCLKDKPAEVCKKENGVK